MFQVLVVEDDKDLNRTVCAYLNSSGYKATGCLSASEAYDAMYGTGYYDARRRWLCVCPDGTLAE